ncbi:hypothetical protein AYO20_10721 [Fonsecaea nubica]|uniref:Uncharacterized protein n=1 Tax=Fonsecaea nubica TaxID=856822 RepID=A0A178C4A4_9EURO|nr:hypothetical protein AYO20_10721 [Fonsecaea nubica]OAL24294.1 hypothetical protein AYO20_10721 [Fonsecaea nubica]
MHYALPAVLALAVASASASISFEYHPSVPLERRQEPGTPAYECHANCGGVITAGRTEGYCDSANFTTILEDCLECALEFDIWRYYGESVSAAATGCGLDATPVPASNGTSATEPTATPAPTSTSSAPGTEETGTTSTTASSEPSETTAAPADTASETPEQTASETPAETSSADVAVQTENFGSKLALGGGQVVLPLVALLPALI